MVAIPFINALQQSFTSEAKSKEIDLIFTSQFSNLGIEVNQEKNLSYEILLMNRENAISVTISAVFKYHPIFITHHIRATNGQHVHFGWHRLPCARKSHSGSHLSAQAIASLSP